MIASSLSISGEQIVLAAVPPRHLMRRLKGSELRCNRRYAYNHPNSGAAERSRLRSFAQMLIIWAHQR
jgi:hypothetical protein